MAITLDGSDNKIAIGANATGSSAVRLYEDTDNGTNYVDIIAPSSITSNRTLTLPDATGTLLTNSGTEAGAFSTLSVNSNNISAENSLGFRNRIINGDMRIDQRNAGAAVTINSTANTYTLDRWVAAGQVTDGVFTVDQVTDVPTGQGFTNSAKITVTTADASIGSTQTYIMSQFIEGNNFADAMFGTASAKTITISFWVRSSVTGTFGGSLGNSANDRNYPFTYSISSANTWENKTITVAGDTTGTWLTDTGRGIALRFPFGVGSSYVATAGAWTGTSNIYGATGQTQLISTLNATWFITGVQLEVGSVATPFERRPYGTELALCQRYFFKTFAQGTAPAQNIGVVGAIPSWSGGGSFNAVVCFPVVMRATPTVVAFNTSAANSNFSSGDASVVSSSYISDRQLYVYSSTVTGTFAAIHATASIEL